ncbi:MAG TPA: hypothetical protein VMI54_07615 [Polyangiaceae bacterium]|nr:hypothetical protein [Polyangiaceae bacterium]
MQSAKSQAELHAVLKNLLRDSMRLHAEGAPGSRLGQADGYVDGFVRALVEAGLSDHASILAVIRDTRREFAGPATRAVDSDSSTLAA